MALKSADDSARELEAQQPIPSWWFRLLEAEILLWQSRFVESNALLSADPPSSSPFEMLAKREILQGRTLCRLGKPPEAVFDQAARTIKVGEKNLLAELAFARAKCASISSSAKALVFYQRSADLAQGVDAYIEARARIDIGNIMLHEGQYANAIHEFDKVLKLTDSTLLHEVALGNLGFTYSELGEWQRAAHFSSQAARIASDVKNHAGEKKWMIDLGRESFSQSDYGNAEDSLKKALRIARELHDRDDTVTCLYDLVRVALRTNALDKAQDYVRQLEELKPTGSDLTGLVLSRAELAKAEGRLTDAERAFKEVLNVQSLDPIVRQQAQSYLAVVYVGEGKFAEAEKMFRGAIATMEETRSKIPDIEYRIAFLDYAPFYDEYVRFLVSRNRNIEALDVAELGRSPTLSEGLDRGGRKPLQGRRLISIQQNLRTRHSVVLAYWLAEQHSYLWVITSSQIKLFPLPVEQEIEREAEAYTRAILERDEAAESQRGAKLYDTLVRPAAALMPPGTNVIIVPHRKLYNFNFETIVVPDRKLHYWIEDVRLQNASFLGALAGRPAKTPADPKKKMLLMGAPVLADKHFPQLKFANDEMRKVSAHFPPGEQTVLTGNQATPQAYLDGNPAQYDQLHFVTHGTSSTVAESPLDAAIILSPSGNTSTDPEGSYRLYGRDIMKTPLHASLVTVSACYGLGREYSGEGLVGLAWAFLHAGAHQVIAALWEVDDASTPDLMDDFYAELTEGKSAAEALRDAKLKMLHSSDFHRHPYYWASLQLYTGS